MSEDNRNLRKDRRKLRAIRFYTNRRSKLRPMRMFFVLVCIWSFWTQYDRLKATLCVAALVIVYSVYLLRCYTLGRSTNE